MTVRNTPIYKSLAAFIISCICTSQLLAQESPQLSNSGLELIEAAHSIDVLVDQGKLLKLPRKATKVLVVNPDVASAQIPAPDQLLVFGKKAGKTTVFALDENNDIVMSTMLISKFDLPNITAQVNAEIPSANINIIAAPSGGVIVKGTVETPQQAKRAVDIVEKFITVSSSQNAASNPQSSQVINQLEVLLSAQINIRVRLIEVSRSLTHQLGFSWEALLDDGDVFLRNGATLFDATTGAFDASTISNAVIGGSNSSLGGVLQALNTNGFASVLAEPNLTAMSGESAGFAAGGEVPVVIITNNQTQIEFKQYGVIMRMTPTLLSPNRISLHIAPEVSDLSEEGAVTLSDIQIPAFKVRRADTTVELASGQSFALGGMLRSTLSETITGVPGLRNIPVLGRLFESSSMEQTDSELVMIATAYVVKPTDESELQHPLQGHPSFDIMTPKKASAGYIF